jgi:hypothetical protein
MRRARKAGPEREDVVSGVNNGARKIRRDEAECGETSASKRGEGATFLRGFDETTTTTTSLEPFLPFQLEKQSPSASHLEVERDLRIDV